MTDIPNKIFTEGEEVRLWRFKTPVLDIPPEGTLTEFRTEGPVPVFSGDKNVGFANVERVGRSLIAEVVVDYAIPERLDVENESKIWLVPTMSVLASVEGVYSDTQEACEIPTIVGVKALKFSDQPRTYVPCLSKTI